MTTEIDITPARLRCGLGDCPTVIYTPAHLRCTYGPSCSEITGKDGLLIIVGKHVEHPKAGPGEAAVEIGEEYFSELPELIRLRKENELLRGALDLCMTGGNHLANYLIGARGPRFPEQYPVRSNHDDIRSAFGPGNEPDYDVWCCWDAIMRARSALEDLGCQASVGDERSPQSEILA